MSYTVKIRISGPGLTISQELAVVKTALEKYGYQVSVEDKYPPDLSEDELLERIGQQQRVLPKIALVTEHLPWGG